MGKELYEKRKLEFKEYILKNKSLPKKWKSNFSDGVDMRLWFDNICKHSKFKDYVNEIKNILDQFGLMILTNKEKEIEFLKLINQINRIPNKEEYYFSDNDEMYTWFINYKYTNKEFETIVHNNLKEYKDFNLVDVWTNIRTEFISIIKKLKRIPEHGEAIIQDGIDVRVIYDKLRKFDPSTVEEILLHLETYNKNALTIDDRINELLNTVEELGYIPFLQECRFSDKTDMFTWYQRYKKILPNLEQAVKSRVSVEKENNVNIYIIPNFKSRGGKFYTICSNTGERLDLSNITSFEEAKKLDKNLVKRGGVILKKDEEIATVDFVKGKNK